MTLFTVSLNTYLTRYPVFYLQNMGAGDIPCLLRGLFTVGWYLHCQEHPRREPEWHLMALWLLPEGRGQISN